MSIDSEKIKIPRPGMPVRGSRTGQPIMVLFDLLGRRWAMGIIWNLHNTACTFRELQGRCYSISPSVLNARLKELRASNLVTTCAEGYCLTHAGKKLYSHLEPLGNWAKPWSKKL